jgi:hypothetical protein
MANDSEMDLPPFVNPCVAVAITPGLSVFAVVPSNPRDQLIQ